MVCDRGSARYRAHPQFAVIDSGTNFSHKGTPDSETLYFDVFR